MEMGRGGVYEFDRVKKSAKKMQMPLKWLTLYKILFYRCYNLLLPFIYVSGTSIFFAHTVYPFQWHVLFQFLWHLVGPSISQALPLQKK